LRSEIIVEDAFGRQGLPDTIMAARYLAALVRWAETQPPSTRITIPTGETTAAEIRIVLKNLKLAGATGRKDRYNV
jgi:hypothetical protein